MPDSLWAATAPPGPACPLLKGPAEADVAIVGGGFTGLSAAIHLADAGKTVRLLDAAEPGWGGSGRNGGQVNPGWKILPDEIRERFGEERAARVIAMASTTCDLVFDLIERFNIDCDALRPGYVQGAFGARGRRMAEDWARSWSRYVEGIELLDRDALEMLIGSRRYDSGMFDPRGGNIQPLSYARGLAHAAAGLGVDLHGQSPVRSIERRASGWILRTGEGSVEAPRVLIGTNGYTDDLWPGLQAAVVPLPSFVIASKPLGHNTLASVLPGRHAVSETRRLMVYYRLDRDDRFVIGGRGNLLDIADSGSVDHVKAAALDIYPQLGDTEWEYTWGGYVAMTPEKSPKLMRLAEGVFAGMGFNGRGVAMSTMMGKQLALAALGEDPDMPVTPLARIPLHPLRQIGISWRLATGRLLDRMD